MPSPTEQHLSDFGNLSLLAEILDLVLEGSRKFPRRRMSISLPPFIACLIELQFGAKRTIHHAAAELDDQAAD